MPFRAKKEAGSGERDSKSSLYADLRIGSSRFAIRALRDFPRVQGMGVAPCSDAVFSTDWINRVFVFMVAAHIYLFLLTLNVTFECGEPVADCWIKGGDPMFLQRKRARATRYRRMAEIRRP